MAKKKKKKMTYAAFIDVTKHDITAYPSTRMSSIRADLGTSMAPSDRFLYESFGEKTVMSLEQEKDATVAATAFPPAGGVTEKIIQIVSYSKSKPSFLGVRPANNWVTQSTSAEDQNFEVQVVLNQHSETAIENNEGMFEPLMLINVVGAVPNNPKSFPNVVVCQKGAIIQFNVRSWGAAGWAYTITAQDTVTSTDIVPSNYPLYTGFDGVNIEFGSKTELSLWRYAGNYQGQGDTIQIESNQALGIASEYNIEYSQVTVTGWSLNSWKASENGSPYTSNLRIPVGTGSEDNSDLATLVDKTTKPGTGKVSVPAGSTQPAAPQAGPPSNQEFGTIWDPTPSSNPGSGGLTGAIDLTFLVFDSKADANAVMKILNQPFGVS